VNGESRCEFALPRLWGLAGPEPPAMILAGSLACLWSQLAHGPAVSRLGQSAKILSHRAHESVEEGRELRIGIERQDVGNILVRGYRTR
jgi:hypothetical protein